MITPIRLIAFFAALLLATPSMAAKIEVMVSVAPLKYFVEEIGGDRVDVHVMVQPGASPATYEPKPRQMVALAKAKMFVAVGVPFEQAWLPRIKNANPGLTIVKATVGMELMPMEAHHHGETEHHHEHGTLDPHVWNSPEKCRKLAGNILSALVRADASFSNQYQFRYDMLMAKIDEVDSRIRKLLEGLEGTHFLVYHPSWGYFAHDYGLVQVPVEIEGKEPGPRELAATVRLAKQENIKVVFVQPQFSARAAETVAKAINGRVVLADPLSEDWENNLLNLARTLKNAWQ